MSDWYRPLHDVPWPLTEDNLEQTIAKLKDHKARDQAEKVLRDQVKTGVATKTHMEKQISKIVAFGKQHSIRVHVGEYGAVDSVPRDSRLRYHQAISDVFDRHRLGRSLWNYSGSQYSVVLGDDVPGERSPDWEMIEALGHDVPSN